MLGFQFACVLVQAQVVFNPATNNGVYELLDELASLRVITLNSVVKPYSRIYIARKLAEAGHFLAGNTLAGANSRISREVDFYLRDYSPELNLLNGKAGLLSQHGEKPGWDLSVSLADSSLPKQHGGSRISFDPLSYRYTGKILKIAVSPELGGGILVNNNGHVWEISGGGTVSGYLGRHFGFYARVCRTWESEALSDKSFLTMEEGNAWTMLKNGSVANTEWRGGISVAWNWGDLGIYRDRPVWGDAQHGSNILSGHAPAFPFIQLHLTPAKWIEFRYIAGLLRSVYLDSLYLERQTPEGDRARKYFIGNITTLTPWKCLQITIGNSVIYSERNINPAFLIPFFFYKSIDQTLSNLSVESGQNNQLFLNVNYRPVNHLTMYSSIFIDDLKMSVLFKKGQHNEICTKAGFLLAGWPWKNISLAGEYTRSNPLTYQHYVTPTDYYSSGYCLGSYLRDNSDELFFRLVFRPAYRLRLSAEYQVIRHGQDYTHIKWLNNYLLPFLGQITYKASQVQLNGSYMVFPRLTLNGGLSARFSQGDVKYAPSIFQGKTYSVFLGFRVGL